MSKPPDIPALQQEAEAALAAAVDSAAVERWRVDWLGRKGRLTAVLRGVRELSPAERPQIGAAANRLKNDLQAAHDARLDDLRGDPA